MTSPAMTSQEIDNVSAPKFIESIYFKQSKQTALKTKIHMNDQLIHEKNMATQ